MAAASSFVSDFKALAHGSLNWDTQLDSDMGKIEQFFADGSGSISWASGVGAASAGDGSSYSVLFRVGPIAMFNMNALATKQLTVGGDDILLAFQGDFRPQVNLNLNNLWARNSNGTIVDLKATLTKSDGGLRIVGASTGLSTNAQVYGNFSYKVA